MVQFNLLPDVKLEYLKAQRTRRLVIGVSAVVTIAVVVIAAVLFSLTELQKHQINSLATDIKQQGILINGHQDLDQILTIQNQVETLEQLHQQEPATDRLAGYLNQIIPVTASLSSFNIDFNANTVSIQGTADSLATVNQLVDTLKFADYTVSGTQGSTPAFSQVVLSSFGLNQGQATYSINFSFDPTIFANTKQITLEIKSQVTTRSLIDQPTQLFKLAPSGGH